MHTYIVDPRAKKFRIFRGAGTPTFIGSTSPLHKHEYAEVHLVDRGYIVCTIEGAEYVLREGDAIIIPGGMFHRIKSGDEKRRHYSFQAELFVNKITRGHFPKELISTLFDNMKAGESGINTLYYICTELSGMNSHIIESDRDYKHAIGHFFDKRHNENVEIKDLAETLHLSVMQTQRLVKKHTGMTFGENVRSYRMKVADYLMETTDMTKEEIAREVGYSSYSGFWKARRLSHLVKPKKSENDNKKAQKKAKTVNETVK